MIVPRFIVILFRLQLILCCYAILEAIKINDVRNS